jgi:hypothetical protein
MSPGVPNDEALSGGPYLRVALVAELDDLVPVNATSLFAEWESALDPIRELRTTAARYLPEDDREWLAAEKYVVATFWTPNLLRAVAKDEAIHDAFRSSLATIRWPGDMTRVYRELKALAECSVIPHGPGRSRTCARGFEVRRSIR